jgi:hypothetical protein
VAPAPAPERDTPAPPAEPRRNFQFDVGVATDFPVFLGGYVGAEVPGRILLQVGAGVMPSPYTSAVNGLLTSLGAYDATVGGLVQSALANPFVLRLSAGWRPFPGHGLEIMGGYTLMHAEGAATEGDVINAVLTEQGSSQRVPAGSGMTVPLTTNLHNVHVSLGWRWLAADDHLVIRASLSYIQCLAADMSVSLPSQGQAMEATVNQQLNAIVTPYFTSYVKAPLLGLSAAYRFY